MADSSLKISVELVDKAAAKALENFINKSKDAGDALDKTKNRGESAFDAIAVHIGKAIGAYDIFKGNIAANIVIKAFDELKDAAKELFNIFIVEGVKAASEQEASINELNNALARSGHFSKETSASFLEFADQLEATTGIQDDVIIKNAALIESLTQLDAKGLRRATKAALDFSAATGKDLTSASEALAKASGGNITAFQKLGIEIQKGATNAQTYQNALQALEKFSGAAAARTNTFSGAVALVNAGFNNLQEAIGNTIIKNNVVVEVMKAFNAILRDTTSDLLSSNKQLQETFGTTIANSIDNINKIIVVMDVFGRIASFALRSATAAFDLFHAASQADLGLGKNIGVLEGFSKVIDKVTGGVKHIFAAFTEETVLSKTSEGLFRIGDAADVGLGKLKAGMTTVKDPINNTTGSIHKLTEAQIKANEETVKWVDGLVAANQGGQVALDARLEQLNLHREQDLLNAQDNFARQSEINHAFYAQKAQIEQDYYDAQQVRLDASLQQHAVTEAKYNAANDSLKAKRDKAEQKNEVEKTKAQKAEDQKRAQDRRDSFAYISSLMRESNNELFAIGKAAALATAYIDGQAAVMKAFGSAPPPFNFILAAAVGLAAAVNIAKIASAQPPSYETGGIVGGSSYTGDNITAGVNSGEMILNRGQQKQLFDIANGSSYNGNIQGLLTALLSKDERVIVNIGGKTIVDSLRSELNAGRSYA